MAMTDQLKIGDVAKQTGVPIRTIRFYEAEGVVPRPPRSPAGYRLYSTVDIRRLRLARNARRLGFSLPQVRSLVEAAFRSDCHDYGDLMLQALHDQRAELERLLRQIADREGLADAVLPPAPPLEAG